MALLVRMFCALLDPDVFMTLNNAQQSVVRLEDVLFIKWSHGSFALVMAYIITGNRIAMTLINSSLK